MSGTSIGNATRLAAASLQATDVIPVERPGVTTPYKTKVSSLTKAVTGMINVVDYGAVGDGTTDDTDAIQDAIDAANALYGSYRNTINLFFPFTATGYLVTSVELKSGVNLYSPSGVGSLGAFLTSTTAGWVIDTDSAEIWHAGIDGVGVVGGGTVATNGLGGVRFQDANRCWIKNSFMTGFANQGVLVSAGAACEFNKLLVYNSLMDRSRSAVAGAVEIYGTDHLMDFIEATTSQSADLTSVTDANLYCTGILVGQSNGFIRDCIGEISDVGIYVSGDYNRFSDCRADLNYGHGWVFAAASGWNVYTGCTANNNSQDTTNTYDGFFVVGTSGQNSQFIGCYAWSSTTAQHRYGFYDPAATATTHNRYTGCYSYNHATAAVGLSSDEFSPSTFEIPHSRRGANFADGDATPSIDMHSMYDTANTGATTITEFDNGIDGQIIRIKADANTTITHGTNIFTTSGADITCAANIIYSFQRRRQKWYQI